MNRSNKHRNPRGAVRGSSELESIPGIGPSLATDLLDLGFHQVSDLKAQDPEGMYRELVRLRGVHQDRCVLYVFRCAVYYASRKSHDPEKLKWWNWSDVKMGRRTSR